MTQALTCGLLALGQGEGGGAPEPTVWPSYIFLAVIFAIFYFFLIRPVRTRQRRHEELLSDLKNGDKVVTQGGIHGTIAGIQDDIVTLRVGDNVKIELDKSAVTGRRSEPEPIS